MSLSTLPLALGQVMTKKGNLECPEEVALKKLLLASKLVSSINTCVNKYFMIYERYRL